MPRKEHSRVIKKFRGLDYSKNDIDRDIEYFKDCENVELSYSNGIRGRIGYRPLLVGMGFLDLFNYESQDVLGNKVSEIILCNGFLWRLKKVTFNITTASSLSWGYDETITYTLPAGQGVNSFSYSPLTLKVNGKDYAAFDYKNIGALWDALIRQGETITYPVSTQTLNWGKLQSTAEVKNQFNAIYDEIGTIQVNDIFGMFVEYPFFKRQWVPMIVTEVGSGVLRLRSPVTPLYWDGKVTVDYGGGSPIGYCGFSGTPTQGILSVDEVKKEVTVAFPEPIPCSSHFRPLLFDNPSKYRVHYSYLGSPTTLGQVVDYSFINANESLFVSCSVNPLFPQVSLGGLIDYS